MTEEQKAEEYVQGIEGDECVILTDRAERKQAYIDGYHEGFKDCAKARLNATTISDSQIKDEWHYVKDCLPEEDVYVLLWRKNDTFPVVARRHTFTSWGRTDWEWDCKWGSGFEIKQNDPRVIAWKEIIPPKEIE